MKFHISEDFVLELTSSRLYLMQDYGGESVNFSANEIDDVIDALKRAKSQILADQRKEKDQEALKRWGNSRMPTRTEPKHAPLIIGGPSD